MDQIFEKKIFKILTFTLIFIFYFIISYINRFDVDFFASGSDAGIDNKELFGSRYLPSVNDAAITSFSVDYETEGGPAFHKNSAPITTVLNMTFTESKIYTRDNVRNEDRLYEIGAL